MLWAAAIVLATANFIAVLDMTIANVSVPNISGSLAISASQGTWVITPYSVAEAIIVPLTGWLAGRFGAVRVFVTAMGLFGVFSTVCGMSSSLGMLVAGRILQGLAGGPLMPLSQNVAAADIPQGKGCRCYCDLGDDDAGGAHPRADSRQAICATRIRGR